MRSVYPLQRQGSPELGHFFDGESALDCRIHPYPSPPSRWRHRAVAEVRREQVEAFFAGNPL